MNSSWTLVLHCCVLYNLQPSEPVFKLKKAKLHRVVPVENVGLDFSRISSG